MPGLGLGDHHGIEPLLVELDRTGTADDTVTVARLAHAAEGGDQQGLADPLPARRLVDAGRAEKALAVAS